MASIHTRSSRPAWARTRRARTTARRSARDTDERIVEIEKGSADEKSAALDACSVYAMPSLHETFGIGYLEAWLHGKPVLGGDIPPLREVITHGVDGLLVQQKVPDIA